MSNVHNNKPVILERRALGPGKTLFKQGDEADYAYLIQSGLVKVMIEVDGCKTEIARMGPGEIIGEMALISDSSRTATVEAVEMTNLIVITRQVLKEKIAKSDATIRAVMQMMSKRLNEGNAAIMRQTQKQNPFSNYLQTQMAGFLANMTDEEHDIYTRDVKEAFETFIDALLVFEKSRK